MAGGSTQRTSTLRSRFQIPCLTRATEKHMFLMDEYSFVAPPFGVTEQHTHH